MTSENEMPPEHAMCKCTIAPVALAHVRLDTRRYDVAVVRVDEHGHAHIAVHVRDSLVQLAEALGDCTAQYDGATAALDAGNIPQRWLDVYLQSNGWDKEIVVGSNWPTYESAEPMIKWLRLSSGLNINV